MAALRVLVRLDGREQELIHESGPLEVGRGRERDVPRLMVVDPTVSRDHVRLSLQSDGWLLVENLSSSSDIFHDRGPELPRGAQQLLPLPVTLGLGNADLVVSLVAAPPRQGPEPVIGGLETLKDRVGDSAVVPLPPALPLVPSPPAPDPPAAADAPASPPQQVVEQPAPEAVAMDHAESPGAAKGSDREVTMLFLDVPAFTALPARVGAARTFEMLGEIADLATGFIEETEGVVVDGSGASLLAMWNAPFDVNEHPWKACIAAQRLTAAVGVFSDRWEIETGLRLRAKAAVATFATAVGPTSGARRPGYGPIDGGARLRSQAAAAAGMGVGILVNRTVLDRLPADLALRRLGNIRPHPSATAEEFFELQPGPPPGDWAARRDSYERGLRLFEQQQFDEAVTELSILASSGWHADVPTLRLLARALACAAVPPSHFDAAFDVP